MHATSILRHATEAEMSEPVITREEIPKLLSLTIWSLLVCTCAMAVVAWFLLWEVRHSTASESSRVEVSVEGILGHPSCLYLHTMAWDACLMSVIFDMNVKIP